MTPDKFTIKESTVSVGSGHELYVQEWGNIESQTVFLFLHGGPGSGCNDGHKSYFDPERDRVIFFDQRGCGRSTPYGSLENNTTQLLVGDIIKILDDSDIEKVVLVGGSWGSTLALAFAIEYPARVKSMVLRGIFTGSKSEVDFLDKGGFRAVYPDVWQRYVASVPEEYKSDPSAYHEPRLLGDDQEAMKQSALAYDTLESSIMRLDDRMSPEDPNTHDPYPIRMEVFYMSNGCFMPDRYILDKAHTLTMPVTIIQGRYDMVCPPVTALELHQLLPKSQLLWTVAGHSGSDRANYDATKLAIAAAQSIQL